LNTFTPLIVILVAASLLAFLLNYPVSWMERQGAIREQVAILVFFSFINFVGIGCNTRSPCPLPAQQLVIRLPEWIDSGRHQLMVLKRVG